MLNRLKNYGQIFVDSWCNRDQLDSKKRSLDELEFLPAALEIQERPASKMARTLALSLIALFSIALLWACFGQVNIVAVAEGKIIPGSGIKQIQPLEKGVVKSIFVREGQQVTKGEALIELDQTLTAADQQRLIQELYYAQTTLARQQALYFLLNQLLNLDEEELRGLPQFSQLSNAEKIMQAQLLQQEWFDYRARLASLQSQLASREAESEGNRASIKKLQGTLPLISKRTAAIKSLLKNKLVPETQYLELEEKRIEQQQDLLTEQARLQQIESAIDGVEYQISAMQAEMKAQVLIKTDDSERQVASFTQELHKARDINARQILYAPVDGRVQQLAVHTIGGVVTPAQPLMVVVPREDFLEVDAVLENKDIGFVREGMSAEIKVHTFPFTKYGIIDAEVIGISADAIIDESSLKKQGLVYKMRLKMKSSQLFVNGQWIDLLPGMAVSAEVKTGKRKIIEYVTAPLLRYKDESIRER